MPNIHSPSQHVKAVVLAHNQAAAGNSAASADCLGFTRAMVVATVTTAAASGVTVNVQDAPDNVTWTAVAGATTGALGASLTSQPYVIDLNLSKRQRYINTALAGVAGTISVDTVILLFNARYSSLVAQANTPIQVL